MTVAETASDAIYTCPMHPEVRHIGPGSCPDCGGMALEPLEPTATETDDGERRDMTRRLWVSAALTVPLLFLAMSDVLPGMPVQKALGLRLLGLAGAAAGDAGRAVGGGWPFFVRGVQSVRSRSPQYVQPDRARHRGGVWV